jgi:hypothetical protein
MYKSLTSILCDPGDVPYEIQGYKTAYPSLDYSLGGISTTDLVLIAAKPGNWSSILVLNLVVGLSHRYHVLLINTTKNATAAAMELKSVLLPGNEAGDGDEETMNELNRLAANIYIEDEARFLEDIEQVLARFHSEYPVDAIVAIDNLNNIFLSKEIRTYPRSREEGEIASNLKMLTLKYNMPVLLLAKTGSPDPFKKKYPPALCDLDYLVGLSCPFNKIIGVSLSGDNSIHRDEKERTPGNKLFLHILQNEHGKPGLIRLAISESNRFRLENEDDLQIV